MPGAPFSAPRDRQRRLRRGGESRGIRRQPGAGRCRARVLGKLFRRRSFRTNHCARPRTTSEEILVVECDPAQERRHAPQLAVPPRPPHRRLPADFESLARRMNVCDAPQSAQICTSLPTLGLSHARRMGAARSHLARLAARSDRLAGEISRPSRGPMRKSCAISRASNASYLLVENRRSTTAVRSILKQSGANLDAVDFFAVPTDRGWMRDSGPICVTNANARSGTHTTGIQRLGEIFAITKRCARGCHA